MVIPTSGAEAPGLRRHFSQARRILASPAVLGRLTLNPGYRQPGLLLEAKRARHAKVDGGATQHMLWDGNDLLAQVDASGNTLNFYSRGATLVKQRNPSGWTFTQEYLHLDPQGSVLIRSQDDNSASSGVLDPDPWGGDPSLRWGRVVVDSFTRPDATTLGNVESGGSWTEMVDSPSIPQPWGIQSGQAAPGQLGVNHIAWAFCPSSLSDVRVKVRLTVGTVVRTGVGLFFRSDSSGNGLVLHYLGGSTNNWRWSRLQASPTSITGLATVTGPQLTQGQSYDLEVRASGSQCAGYVGGVQIGGTQTITSHQTDTQHGLYVHESQDHRFENFSVEAEQGPLGWLAEPGYYTEQAVMRPLYYVRARWYEAGGPGWLSKDPIGLGGGDVNLYRYVRNQPLVAVDPSGLFALDGDSESTGIYLVALGQASTSTEATDCRMFGKECLEYIFNNQRPQPARQQCFKKHGDWATTLIGCACQYGANPLLLLAIAWIENHFGTPHGKKLTPQNQEIICHNPFSIHFQENAKGLLKLCKPGNVLPTFKEAACAAARVVHRDQGVKSPAFGGPSDVNLQYAIFKRRCLKAGKK